MNRRGAELAQRREQLTVRSWQLRQQAASQMEALQPALSWVDRLQDAWLWLRANPAPVLAGLLGLVVWRPRRALGVVWRAWSGWRLLQRLRSGRTGLTRLP
jgi:hypothetical protein